MGHRITAVRPGHLADWVSEYTGFHNTAAKTLIRALLTHILDELDKTGTVTIENFGRFEKRVWHNKSVYNFHTKQAYRKDVTVIYFRPADNVWHIRLNGHANPRRKLKHTTEPSMP